LLLISNAVAIKSYTEYGFYDSDYGNNFYPDGMYQNPYVASYDPVRNLSDTAHYHLKYDNMNTHSYNLSYEFTRDWSYPAGYSQNPYVTSYDPVWSVSEANKATVGDHWHLSYDNSNIHKQTLKNEFTNSTNEDTVLNPVNHDYILYTNSSHPSADGQIHHHVQKTTLKYNQTTGNIESQESSYDHSEK
jgi:hypothetical protein